MLITWHATKFHFLFWWALHMYIVQVPAGFRYFMTLWRNDKEIDRPKLSYMPSNSIDKLAQCFRYLKKDYVFYYIAWLWRIKHIILGKYTSNFKFYLIYLWVPAYSSRFRFKKDEVNLVFCLVRLLLLLFALLSLLLLFMLPGFVVFDDKSDGGCTTTIDWDDEQLATVWIGEVLSLDDTEALVIVDIDLDDDLRRFCNSKLVLTFGLLIILQDKNSRQKLDTISWILDDCFLTVWKGSVFVYFIFISLFIYFFV